MRRLIVPLSLLLAVVTAPAAGAAAPADFEQWVAAQAFRPLEAPAQEASAARVRPARTVVTPPRTAPRRFDLLGLRSRGGAAHVDLRVQRPDGRWSRWVEAHGPVWAGGARRYQLRAERLPRGLALHFVAVGEDGAAPTAGVAGAGPAIVPRSRWDPGDACTPRAPARYGRVDLAFVHHTESLVSYSAAEAPRVVLAICRFHRNGNGWLDIGYNLLVDRFGTVYEGRAGGVDQPVIGAQAGGWNTVSTGVALIGSHTTRRPSRAALDALADVLAWKLALAGVPPTGSVSAVSGGGPESRYAAGLRVAFQRISGHRDGDHTDCPGDALYALLPRIRADVAERWAIAGDLLTLSPVGGALAPGGPAWLTGRLALAGGRRPVGARIALQQRVDGGWQQLGTVLTGSDGIWSTRLPLTTNGTFRAVAGAGDRTTASPAIDVAVQAGVSALVRPQLLRRGRSLRVHGATSPPKPRVTVMVERRAPRGDRWLPVRRLTLATTGGTYDVVVRLHRRGVHRFLVTTDADAVNAAGVAPIRTARVR